MTTGARENKLRKWILLLDNSRERNLHSIVLHTAGYDVESTGNEAEAHVLCRSMPPNLLLVAANESLARTWEISWKLQYAYPQQRIALLYTDSIQLCPLFQNGRLTHRAEGPEDLVERIETLIGVL